MRWEPTWHKLLTDTASRHGRRPALKLDDAVVTYELFNEGASRVAGALKARGLQPGAGVGVMRPNVSYSGWPTTGCCAPAAWSCR